MHLISHHALNANSTGTSMPHAQHISLLCQMVFLPLWSFFFSFFMGVHSSIYFLYLLVSNVLLASFFACFLISSLAPLIMHSRYSDPLLMRWRWGWRKKWKEKWSGFDWRRRKRGNHQLWNRNVSETYTTGVVVLFFVFTLVFYNKQQKLQYF